MKKLLTIMALAAMAATASAQTNKSTIKCKFDGLTNDTIVVQVGYASNQEKSHSDTIVTKKGKYEFTVADDYAVNVMFGEKPKPGQRGWLMADVTQLTVLPGETITVTGNIKGKAVIKGSAFADEQKQLDVLTKDVDDEMQRLIKERTDKIAAGGDEDKLYNEYSKLFEDIRAKKTGIIKGYVAQHPDSPLSAYYAGYDLMDKGEMFALISDKAKNGVMKYFIEQMQEYKKQQDERIAKLEAVKNAKVAPDFTAKDLNGKDFTLSSLYNKGKYILLDFWGSWCHWCLKAVPKMKAVYEPNKAKMEILSVDCNDTEEKWRKAVKEHDLPWLHVKSEKDNNIADMYGVQGFPTFILISPEGNVLKVQTGTDDEFYKWLEETVTK